MLEVDVNKVRKFELRGMGYMVSINIDKGEEVKLIVKFNSIGTYMYHCHILEHEEEGMMGQIKIE